MSIYDRAARLRFKVTRSSYLGGRNNGQDGTERSVAVLTAAREALGQGIPLDAVLLFVASLVMAMG